MGLTSSIQYTLRDKDIKKASELFGIEIAILERLNSQRLLDVTYIRNLLMRADWERLTSGLHYLEKCDKEYRFPEVMKAIQREYGISKANLQKVLHGKNEAILFCKVCGARITRRTSERTDGLCSNCFSDTIDLEL